jgi:glycosyltransferase involved in cell wall biosynthesis
MISDNASTDGTAQIIEAYKANHPCIRSVRGDQMISLSENWNRAYQNARGEWVKILAHDDKLHRDCLKRINEELERLPATALSKIALVATGEYWLFDGDVRYENTTGRNAEGALLLKAPNYVKALIGGTTRVGLPGATTATLHKPVITISGPYDKRFFQSDTILYTQLLVEHDYLYIPDALCENRIQSASAHNTAMKGRRTVEEQVTFSREFLPTVKKKLEMGFYARMRFRMRPASQAASQVSRGILCAEMSPLWAALRATPGWQLPVVLPLTLRALARDMRKLRQIELPARIVL